MPQICSFSYNVRRAAISVMRMQGVWRSSAPAYQSISSSKEKSAASFGGSSSVRRPLHVRFSTGMENAQRICPKSWGLTRAPSTAINGSFGRRACELSRQAARNFALENAAPIYAP